MADTFPPLAMTWNGEAFIPRRPRQADRYLVIGQEYVLVEHHVRSHRSHAFFFASVEEAWKNLRDEDALRYPSPDHLRKWALIKMGFRDERSVVCSSPAEAERVAALVKDVDCYAVVVVHEAVVTVYTAKSMAMNAMDRQTFMDSSRKVLDLLADLIGVTAAELQQNTGRAA